MQMNPEIAKPALSRRGFWDVDQKQLDFDGYPDFTVVRVMERGTSMISGRSYVIAAGIKFALQLLIPNVFYQELR